jgi:4-hydroxybenzoate polyprenyltransferase
MARNVLISAIRLTRPINLLIILATILGVCFYLSKSNPTLAINTTHFWLLSISTVLIAAGGNIINDFYDLKADQINKPSKVILSKNISKELGLKIYIALNFLALSLGLYLSFIFDTFWFASVHTFCILLLWFYSYYLKKILFLGNLLIAGLTGFIPLYAASLYSFGPVLKIYTRENPKEWFDSFYFEFIIMLAVFALLQNLVREIWKDAADIEGDQTIGVVSIPIKFGIKKTQSIIGFILLIEIALFSFCLDRLELQLSLGSFILFSVALSINILILILMYKKELFVKYCDFLLKLSMVIGLSTLYF